MDLSGRRASLLHWLRTGRRRRQTPREPSRTEPCTLGDVLSGLEPLSGGSSENCPVPSDVWRQIVGPRIAERSSPAQIDSDKTLVIRVPSSVWAQELSLLSNTVIARLGALGIEVRHLRFYVGPLPASLRAAPSLVERRKVAPPAKIPEELQSDIASISDPILRDTITRAVALSLGANQIQEPPSSKTTPPRSKPSR